MKKDYTYCTGGDCIHKQSCKRWLGNYSNKKKEKAGDLWKIAPVLCISNEHVYYEGRSQK